MSRVEPPERKPASEEDQPIALLLLWAEAVANLDGLPHRRRAGVLARLDVEICAALAREPDKELIYPWQIQHINQAFGFEVIPAPRRDWRRAPEAGAMRVIGEG